MKRTVWIVGAIATGASLIGCAAPDATMRKPAKKETTGVTANTLTVQGRVSSSIALMKARVVAIGENGRMFWVQLDAKGEFTLKLPIGQSYRVLVANTREAGGQEVIGHLMLNMSRGRTQWLGANQAGTVNLGTLRPAQPTGSGVTIQCSGCNDMTDGDDDDDDDDDADHSDDYECQEAGGGSSAGTSTGGVGAPGDGDDDDDDDDDHDVNLCTPGGAGTSTALEPTKTPSGAMCDDDDDDDHDNDSPVYDGKACQ